jgi:YD repeat-containing protein
MDAGQRLRSLVVSLLMMARFHPLVARFVVGAVVFVLTYLLLSPLDAFAGTGTRTSSWQYDGATGLLTQEAIEPNTASLKLQTDYTYDAFGNKTQATVSGQGIASRSSSSTFDAKGQFVTTSTNALSQSESWTYDDRFGVPLTHTGPNGLTTSWSYDTLGRMLSETRPDGTITKYAYLYCSGVNGGTQTCPSLSATVTVATPYASDGTTQNGPWAKSYADALGRVIATETQGFNAAVIRKDTQYDAKGRTLQESRPYFLSSGTPKWTVYTYDALGRVTRKTDPNGAQSDFTYSGLTNSVTSDLGQSTTTVKNSRGETVSVTDSYGKTVSYLYDPFGNLLRRQGQCRLKQLRHPRAQDGHGRPRYGALDL